MQQCCKKNIDKSNIVTYNCNIVTNESEVRRMKWLRSKKTGKNHIVIVVQASKEDREKIKKELRKTIRKIKVISESDTSYEIFT